MPTGDGLRCLAKAMHRVARGVPRLAPWSTERVLEHFTGLRRLRYERAALNLQRLGLERGRHARISSFVKSEKFNPLDKVNPDPRMIQARTPEYGVEIAKYLKPIEHVIYRLKGPTGLRMIAKGLNQFQRAELLRLKMAQFADPIVVSLDCSRWDKHCSREVLCIEHAFYLRVINDPHFQRLLSWQLDNRCCTNNGVKYRVHGGRMSGDMNTALGNCLLAVFMIHAVMAAERCWDCLDDGDDMLLICESSVWERVKVGLPNKFLALGQELKIDCVARKICDVLFCQSKVAVGAAGFQFVRDWRKVLSQAACGVAHWGDPNMVRPMLATVGTCELALNAGVPVLQEFALCLIRNAMGAKPRLIDVDRGYEARVSAELGARISLERLMSVKSAIVTDTARQAFEEAWGLSPTEQLWVEAALGGWCVTSTVSRLVPPELDSEWRTSVQLDVELPTI